MITVEPHTETRSWMVVSDNPKSAFAKVGFETKPDAVRYAKERENNEQ